MSWVDMKRSEVWRTSASYHFYNTMSSLFQTKDEVPVRRRLPSVINLFVVLIPQTRCHRFISLLSCKAGSTFHTTRVSALLRPRCAAPTCISAPPCSVCCSIILHYYSLAYCFFSFNILYIVAVLECNWGTLSAPVVPPHVPRHANDNKEPCWVTSSLVTTWSIQRPQQVSKFKRLQSWSLF